MNNIIETATIGTQVWKYHMRDMFDDFAAADYEHGAIPDMTKRFNAIRAAYVRAGYVVKDRKQESSRIRDRDAGISYTQIRKSFSVLDVPLKCLGGKKAKELLVHMWINKP